MQQDCSRGGQKLKSSGTEVAIHAVGQATSCVAGAHFSYKYSMYVCCMQQTYLQIGAYLTLINTELH